MTDPALAAVLAFAGLAAVMTLVPGADTVLVLRTSLRDGARAGIATAAGVGLGVVAWGALAGLGVALVLTRVPLLYTLVAVAGGGYLAFLAVRCFIAARRSWRSRNENEVVDASGTPRTAGGRHLLTGLTTNLLNPKIGVFYLSVMPGLFAGQEVGPWLGAGLGAIHAVFGLVWLGGIALFASSARRMLARPAANAIVELVCGCCLLAFAAFVIVESLIHALAG